MGEKKFKRNIVSDTVSFQHEPKLKTNMRWEPNTRVWVGAQGYPLDPVSPPKLLFSSTQ